MLGNCRFVSPRRGRRSIALPRFGQNVVPCHTHTPPARLGRRCTTAEPGTTMVCIHALWSTPCPLLVPVGPVQRESQSAAVQRESQSAAAAAAAEGFGLSPNFFLVLCVGLAWNITPQQRAVEATKPERARFAPPLVCPLEPVDERVDQPVLQPPPCMSLPAVCCCLLGRCVPSVYTRDEEVVRVPLPVK